MKKTVGLWSCRASAIKSFLSKGSCWSAWQLQIKLYRSPFLDATFSPARRALCARSFRSATQRAASESGCSSAYQNSNHDLRRTHVDTLTHKLTPNQWVASTLTNLKSYHGVSSSLLLIPLEADKKYTALIRRKWVCQSSMLWMINVTYLLL